MNGGWFHINTKKTLLRSALALYLADVDVHTMQLLDVKDLEHGSGWGTVPTPVF